MKLSLVVLTTGANQGKSLEIKLSQFVVGRDPQCHLRPASPMISKRHCAILHARAKCSSATSTAPMAPSSTIEPVKGEVELNNADELKIGPLLFAVKLEMPAAGQSPHAAAAEQAENQDRSPWKQRHAFSDRPPPTLRCFPRGGCRDNQRSGIGSNG